MAVREKINVTATAGITPVAEINQHTDADAKNNERHNAVVECVKCFKWRRIQFGVDPDQLGDDWNCLQNTWDAHKTCEVPGENIEYD